MVLEKGHMIKKKKAHQGIKLAARELKEAYHQIKESHLEMIFRLALLAEYRDSATGTHLVRIADYSAIIAEGLGLSKEEVEIIKYASPMHDIGKVMLPDAILKKKAKLTEEEMNIVRKHPEAGSRIFANAKSPIMKACGVIALTHHERFDGTGYPKALKGEEIPLYGRIIALVDCFDAYISKRSYKEAYSFKASCDMVKERSGTHFDPKVVDAFIKEKERIRRVWKANRDIDAFLEDMGIDSEGIII